MGKSKSSILALANSRQAELALVQFHKVLEIDPTNETAQVNIGFTYLLRAELDKAGLLLDFKDLREVMRNVIDRLDHQMMNDIEPFTTLNPSAENLAKYFYDESNSRLQRVTGGRVRVKNVTVYETDTTTATYSES